MDAINVNEQNAFSYASKHEGKMHACGHDGHASAPDVGIDPLVVSAEIILALQTIVARNVNPTDIAVVSCTEIHTDGAMNVIPTNVTITGDTRSYTPEVSQLLEERMDSFCKNIAKAYGAECDFSYSNSF